MLRIFCESDKYPWEKVRFEAEIDVEDVYIDEESMNWVSKLMMTISWSDNRILTMVRVAFTPALRINIGIFSPFAVEA